MKRSVYFLSILACSGLWFSSCSDDSDSGKNSGNDNTCQCEDGQVCNDNGDCIEDPNKPGPDDPDKPDACDNKCNPDQTCKDGQCVDSEDPAPDPCKPGCGPDQTCTDNGCIDNSKICEPACTGDRECVDNQCEFTCEVHCGESCCAEGQACDTITQQCGGTCAEGVPECNGFCCDETQECLDGFGCAIVCQESEHRCVNEQSQMAFCCQSNELCDMDAMKCVIDCGSNERCNEACCGDGEVCLGEKGCKPACQETQKRCGKNEDLCCNENEICIFNKCLAKGNTCKDSNECNLDEFCDPASNSCVKASESPNFCEYHPPVGEFHPVVKWFWKGSVPTPPVVINLTDDNHDGVVNEDDVPDVVFLTYSSDLYALNGDSGTEIASSPYTNFSYDGWNDFAAADVDNDGKVEVLISTYRTDGDGSQMGLNVMTLNDKGDGTYEWSRKAFVVSGKKGASSDMAIWSDLHPQIADLDQDGRPEIVTTYGVINTQEWKFSCNYILPCTSGKISDCPYNSMQSVADLDQDNESEIIANNIYDKECNIIVPESESGWYYTAVADMRKDDNDPKYPGELQPEIIRVKSGMVSIWKVYVNKDADNKKIWSQRKIWEAKVVDNQGNANKGGGNPVIADFDGDGNPDIGLATYDYYIVFNGKTGEVMWTSKTQDHTSDKTGSSVFDFEGDGKAEVIYRDETKLRIYAGPGGELETGNLYKSGKVLFEAPSTSGTGIEYPLVVDVDNDGKSEVVVVSNEGVTIYTDAHNNWVRTRRIWNQHAYHVTNINEDGSVPQHEQANWLIYNNYRQNVQPEGAFNAPNFTPGKLDSEAVECDLIKLTAHVKNEGSYGIKAGLPVNFYVVNPNGKTGNFLIGTAYTVDALPPAGETTAILEWNRTVTVEKETITVDMPVDIFFHIDEKTDETPTGMYAECDEKDNRSEATQVSGCGVN